MILCPDINIEQKNALLISWRTPIHLWGACVFLRKTRFLLYLGALMKPIHIPRSLLIIVLSAILLAFFFGTFRAFDSVRAALPATGGTSSLAAAAVAVQPRVSPTEAPTPTATPVPVPPSADTTGIIVMGVVIVLVIIFGTAWGARKPARKIASK